MSLAPSASVLVAPSRASMIRTSSSVWSASVPETVDRSSTSDFSSGPRPPNPLGAGLDEGADVAGHDRSEDLDGALGHELELRCLAGLLDGVAVGEVGARGGMVVVEGSELDELLAEQ